MKKIYLFLLVTVLAFAGNQKSAYAGNNGNCPTIDSWDVLNPSDPIYPFGIVTGTYSGANVLDGDLFYEGSFLYNYQSTDGSIFLFDLNPGSYEFFYCGTSQQFTITGLACDVSIVNIATTNVSGAGCTPNGAVDLTVTSSAIGATYYYNLTEILTSIAYTGQDDGFGIMSITGLPPGVYTLLVSTEPDVLLSTCFASDLVIIEEPGCDMAIPTSSSTDASSTGGSDGSISVSVTGSSCIPIPPGGIPVYNVYAELNGSFYNDLSFNPNNGNYELGGLMAGVYTIIASNGGTTCFASEVITINEPGCNLAAPVAVGLNTTICNGQPAILSVPDIYASYQWLYEGSILIPTGFAGTDWNYWAYLEGNYSVIVTDINGCTATSNSIFVSAPLSPEINFPETFYSCDNSITITAPAGFDTYLWSTNETTASITITTDGWYGLAAGVNALTCGVVDTFYVSLNNTAPTASINVIGANPFCIGTSITLESSSTTDNLWSTGATSQSISVNATGNYSVTVSNAIGCTAQASVNVTAQSCVPATQLVNGVCGNLGFVRTSAISCVTVAGATQYEWEFSNNNGVYATKLTPVSYLGLHGVTPILNWGTTWSVRVRAIIGTNAGVYSTPCTIGIINDPAIAGVPTTQLRPQDCGKLNYRFNADNRLITLPISGATQYEFEFSIPGGAVVATAIRSNTVLFLNTVTPALAFPAQYNVRTRARLGGVWGNFGQPCLIGIIGLNRDGAEADELAYDAEGNIVVDAPYFELTAMPNPYSDITSLIINSSFNENVYVQFFDMTGKLVEDIKVTTNERFNVGANFSQGIYLLKARSDRGDQITTRLVKTN